MPIWAQNLVVVILVAAALGFVLWQAIRSLWGRKSRVGSCCARGCQPTDSEKPQGAKTQFLPAEMLVRRK